MSARKLVIVESPSKAKTIKKFLGPEFDVRASLGHVIDLPPKGLGINIRRNFAPRYEVIKGKEKVIEELREAAAGASEVYLAPDPDREGEAISWHLANALDLTSAKRAVFNEITKSAVQQGIAQTRDIDVNRVNAQQARRILDRMVGYKISPLLWRKVMGNTSAGRVQSVALRLVCDREQEIRAFVAQESWTIEARVAKRRARRIFAADAVARIEGDRRVRLAMTSAAEAEVVRQVISGAALSVTSVERREVKRQPPLPYTTSTLQQDSSTRLRFSPKKAMSLAQALYEGVDLGERGTQGLITYMRTDSTRISEEATTAQREYITGRFGKKYVGGGARPGRKKEGRIQDAHEAIRPTEVTLDPEAVKPYLTTDQFRVYALIWQRFVAAGMRPALFQNTAAEFEARGDGGAYMLRATGTQLEFDGFYAVWPRDEERDTLLPDLAEGETLDAHGVEAQQHFTQPPPRYSEASLIKELEELGIGRPSTYVPILSTIQLRKYVTLEGRRFKPEWLGETINELMTRHFPRIVDSQFTSDMENTLDGIEDGRREWVDVLDGFYTEFRQTLARAEEEIGTVEKPVEATDQFCPLCGNPMVIKMGRYGRFLSCSNYPTCEHSEQLLSRIGVPCPKCGGDVIEKTTKRGRVFYGCSNYPTCDFASWDRPVAAPCPECGGLVVVAGRGGGLRCTVCKTAWDTPPEEPAQETERAGEPSAQPLAPALHQGADDPQERDNLAMAPGLASQPQPVGL